MIQIKMLLVFSYSMIYMCIRNEFEWTYWDIDFKNCYYFDNSWIAEQKRINKELQAVFV